MRPLRSKIFLVTYGGGHVNMVLPVIKELKKEGRHEIHVLGLTTASKVLSEHNIAHLTYRDLVASHNKRALEIGKKLAANYQTDIIPREETIAYLGLCYFDLEQRLGPEEAKRQYQLLGRKCFLPLTIMEKLIKAVAPDLVFTTNSPRSEKAGLLTAKKLGIPAICLCPAFEKKFLWIAEKGYGDVVCVLSEGMKNSLIEQGRPEKEIITTGSPALDYLQDPKIDDSGKILRKKYNWKNDFVILWASQDEPEIHPETLQKGDPELPDKVLKQLLHLIEKHSNWRLVIRPHPSQTLSLKGLPARAQISTQKENLAHLLKAVDLVVLISSTVGVQASMLGTPIIQLTCSILKDASPFIEHGLALEVDSIENLENGILKVANNQWQAGNRLSNQGNATKRVIEIINFILDKKKGLHSNETNI